MPRLRVAEICAGAGGQSLGLHLAGFHHAVAVELDETAAATLRSNLNRLSGSGRAPLVAVGDVADPSVWNPSDFAGVDLLAGGVPCPPFSLAGKQLGASDERDLFAWAVELVAVIRPRALMLENVRGLMSKRFSAYRQAVLDRLAELGYVADWKLLEAKDYGVPQLRPRTILVALRPEDAAYFEWPEPKPTQETVGSTLIDLIASNGWAGAEDWAVKADGIAPTIVGGSKKHGGADLGPTRAKAAWRQLAVDGMGVADSAPDGNAPVDLVPRLTNQMLARLQGWNGPEYEWEFFGRKTSVYRQIGNAFPPPVARAVGQSIAGALRHEGRPRAVEARIGLQDAVYLELKARRTSATAAQIAKALGAGWTEERVLAHLDNLARDFDVRTSSGKSGARYRLGAFRAFRGQPDHIRHETFAESRGSIS